VVYVLGRVVDRERKDGGVVCRRNRGLVGNIRGEVRNVGIKFSVRERERGSAE
jgi:hypothetical protein